MHLRCEQPGEAEQIQFMPIINDEIPAYNDLVSGI